MLKAIGFEDKQIFFNLYVPNGENYQQIDVLVVCKIGIIVFEVKDYQGLISGGIDDKYWRAIYSWHNFYEMYNPITQNSNHIECLKKYFKELNFINVVVFFGKCNLKYTKFLSKTCCVIYGNYLQDCIKYLYFHNKKNNSTIKKEYSDFLNKFMENGNNEETKKAPLQSGKELKQRGRCAFMIMRVSAKSQYPKMEKPLIVFLFLFVLFRFFFNNLIQLLHIVPTGSKGSRIG